MKRCIYNKKEEKKSKKIKAKKVEKNSKKVLTFWKCSDIITKLSPRGRSANRSLKREQQERDTFIVEMQISEELAIL